MGNVSFQDGDGWLANAPDLGKQPAEVSHGSSIFGLAEVTRAPLVEDEARSSARSRAGPITRCHASRATSREGSFILASWGCPTFGGLGRSIRLRTDRPLIRPSRDLDGEAPAAQRLNDQAALEVGGVRPRMAPRTECHQAVEIEVRAPLGALDDVVDLEGVPGAPTLAPPGVDKALEIRP